ncbi:MAG: glycosyltransferase family 4 protein, partial [Proteobacteria bacterium]|nr:glycosyltransferase family 4 protein [Burkholderiales bacterium]
RDVLREGQGAAIVPEDEGAFAARVVQLLTDRPALAALAARTRPYAETWSAGAMAKRLVDWYAQVIDARRGGASAVRPVAPAS